MPGSQEPRHLHHYGLTFSSSSHPCDSVGSWPGQRGPHCAQVRKLREGGTSVTQLAGERARAPLWVRDNDMVPELARSPEHTAKLLEKYGFLSPALNFCDGI